MLICGINAVCEMIDKNPPESWQEGKIILPKTLEIKDGAIHIKQ